MGNITTLIFHCIFNNDGSIWHVMHENINAIAEPLPNTYAVCIAENKEGKKLIRAGFVMKSTLHHTNDGFVLSLKNACMSFNELKPFILADNISFLPAKLGMNGIQLPTEDECLNTLYNQYIKHSKTSLPN